MIAVFAYHSVGDVDYIYAISPADFERQLAYIKKHFKIISVRALETLLETGKMPSRNLALITFDDGLKDNYEKAFPILNKLGIPATIFLATGSIGSTFETKSGSIKALNWPEIKEMQASGMITFESHTHTHPNLTDLDEDEMRSEFKTSNQIIEEHLGVRPCVIAYPKGKYDKRVQAVAKESFSLGFGGDGVVANIRDIDMFAIPRIIISNLIPAWKFVLFKFPLYWKFKSLFGTK